MKQKLMLGTIVAVIIGLCAFAYFTFVQNNSTQKSTDLTSEELDRETRIKQISELERSNQINTTDKVDAQSDNAVDTKDEIQIIPDSFTTFVRSDSGVIENSNGYSKYVNTDMGFSFEYPSGFGELDLKQTITMWGEDKIDQSYYSFMSSSPNGYVMGISIQGNKYQKDTDGIFNPICTLPKTSSIECKERSNSNSETYYFAPYEGMPDNFDRYEFPLTVDASFVIEYGLSDVTPAQKKAYQHMINTFAIIDESTADQSVEPEGVTYKAPKGWVRQEGKFTHDASEKGVTFESPDHKLAQNEFVFGEDKNGIAEGATLSLGSIPANDGWTSEKYAKFQSEINEDCSNCVESSIKSIDGIQAAFVIYEAQDQGGDAKYEFYYDGLFYSVRLHFAGDFKNYKKIVDDFIASIDLK